MRHLEHQCSGRLFLVPLDPLMLLRLFAPLSLPLRLNHHPPILAGSWTTVFTVATDISVEGRAVYLILLKSQNVLIELFLTLRVSRLVKRFRISKIGGVKQKVGGVVNQELFRRNCLTTFRSFTHDFPSYNGS